MRRRGRCLGIGCRSAKRTPPEMRPRRGKGRRGGRRPRERKDRWTGPRSPFRPSTLLTAPSPVPAPSIAGSTCARSSLGAKVSLPAGLPSPWPSLSSPCQGNGWVSTWVGGAQRSGVRQPGAWGVREGPWGGAGGGLGLHLRSDGESDFAGCSGAVHCIAFRKARPAAPAARIPGFGV